MTFCGLHKFSFELRKKKDFHKVKKLFIVMEKWRNFFLWFVKKKNSPWVFCFNYWLGKRIEVEGEQFKLGRTLINFARWKFVFHIWSKNKNPETCVQVHSNCSKTEFPHKKFTFCPKLFRFFGSKNWKNLKISEHFFIYDGKFKCQTDQQK